MLFEFSLPAVSDSPDTVRERIVLVIGSRVTRSFEWMTG